MKKLTIGRNNACDIIIPNTSDLVSRKQAVLAFTFFGKMTLYDTSHNGTYVNGQRLENGKGQRVTRKDKVNFSHVADLDWSQVKDPYRQVKVIVASIVVAVLLLGGLAAWWFTRPELELEPTSVEQPQKGPTETTVKEPVPQSETQPATPESNPKQRKKGGKHKQNKNKKSNAEDVLNKEVNNKSPLVY